jgi:hypothetical protein
MPRPPAPEHCVTINASNRFIQRKARTMLAGRGNPFALADERMFSAIWSALEREFPYARFKFHVSRCPKELSPDDIEIRWRGRWADPGKVEEIVGKAVAELVKLDATITRNTRRRRSFCRRRWSGQ